MTEAWLEVVDDDARSLAERRSTFDRPVDLDRRLASTFERASDARARDLSRLLALDALADLAVRFWSLFCRLLLNAEPVLFRLLSEKLVVNDSPRFDDGDRWKARRACALFSRRASSLDV